MTALLPDIPIILHAIAGSICKREVLCTNTTDKKTPHFPLSLWVLFPSILANTPLSPPTDTGTLSKGAGYIVCVIPKT